MASWLTPFLPCLVKIDAASEQPLRHILPGTLCSNISILASIVPYGETADEGDDDDELVLRCFLRSFLLPATDEPVPWGKPAPAGPSPASQEPIPRALTMSSKHSRPTKQSEPPSLFSTTGSVVTFAGARNPNDRSPISWFPNELQNFRFWSKEKEKLKSIRNFVQF